MRSSEITFNELKIENKRDPYENVQFIFGFLNIRIDENVGAASLSHCYLYTQYPDVMSATLSTQIFRWRQKEEEEIVDDEKSRPHGRPNDGCGNQMECRTYTWQLSLFVERIFFSSAIYFHLYFRRRTLFPL